MHACLRDDILYRNVYIYSGRTHNNIAPTFNITFTSANFPFVTECGVCALCTSNMWRTVWTTGSYGADIHAMYLYLCLYLLHNSCISYDIFTVNEAPYPSGDCRGYKCIVCSHSIQFGMFQRMRFTNNLTGNRNSIVTRNIGSNRIRMDRKVFGFILRFKIRELFKISRQWMIVASNIIWFRHCDEISFNLLVYSKEMKRTKTYFP